MSIYGNPANIVENKMRNKDYKRGSGRVLETEIVYALIRGMKGKPGQITPVAGTEEDTKRGTDLFWEPENKSRVRIDVTLDFDNKDFMPVIGGPPVNIGVNGNPMQYGIRVGNAYKGFTEYEEPVIVIGFNLDSRTFRQWEDAILDGITNHASEILDTAYDAYDSFTNPDPEKRNAAAARLKENPMWKEPKNLSPNMAKLIHETLKVDEHETGKQDERTPDKS